MVFRFEEFEFDEVTFRLSRAGEPVALEPKALHVLLYLLQNRGRLVRKQELLDQVWPESNVSESAVTRAFVLLRKALKDDSHVPRFVETVPTLGYRFIANVVATEEAALAAPAHESATPIRAPRGSSRASPFKQRWLLSTLLILLVLAGTLAFFVSHRKPLLTERDTIVLGDFSNATGDTVFDGALRQGLAVQLEQSPFLSLISDARIQQVLGLMSQPSGARLTPQIAREVCERTGSVAVLDGSIAALGSEYVLGLRATDCRNGDLIAEEQGQARRKEDVLNTLDGIASKLRTRLGESLASVEKFDAPLAEATTSSLEALRAFSLGQRELTLGHVNEGIPFFRQAVELDPNFVLAIAWKAPTGGGLLEEKQAAENARKAYAMRGKVSQKERLSIEGWYYLTVTGETDKAIAAYQLWTKTYPRDSNPHTVLGVIYRRLGQSEKGLEEHKEALRLQPDDAGAYTNVAADLVSLNRLDEAETLYKQAEDHHLIFQGFAKSVYLLAFLKGDSSRMSHLAASVVGKPGIEDPMLYAEADTEAWYGKMQAASAFTDRAVTSAVHHDARETASSYVAERAMLAAEVGNRDKARADATAAMKLAPNRDVQSMAAIALVRAGDVAAGESLAEQLNQNYPVDTFAQRYWLPAIRSAVALQRHDAARAAALLDAADDIELANPTALSPAMTAVYLHGCAYLALHDGNRAAAEFHKYLDLYGKVRNSPWGALARLGLARAYALQGDPAKARTAYQAFLALWKDADPNMPLLKQARSEYAALPAPSR